SHPGFFYPDSNEWVRDTVSLDTFSGASELILRFRVYGDDGASLFLDDISVSTTLNINESEINNGLVVFPNPSNEFATITYDIRETGQGAEMLIFDIYGKQVRSYKIDHTDKSIRILTSDMSAGNYFLIIKNESGMIGGKKMVVIR
ncbi:MAG TPA: T9SS type A sorting domain-containing protein, partial [Bacteroidetes bacterium]|nr:T9SS type A sorting domain-containing protein [Bacteroidota bacterium]